jgi:hypothetical protein
MFRIIPNERELVRGVAVARVPSGEALNVPGDAAPRTDYTPDVEVR